MFLLTGSHAETGAPVNPPTDVVDRVPTITVHADTCDACGHPAYLYAELPPTTRLPHGGTIAYCGHHGAAYLDGLTRAGARIIDLRHLIPSR